MASAVLQFEPLNGRRGCARSYENATFCSEAGDRVRLEKVKVSEDGRHFEADVVLLPPKGDREAQREPAGGLAADDAEHGCRRRSAQPSQKGQEARRSRAQATAADAEAESSSSRRSSVRMSTSLDAAGVEVKQGDFLTATEDYLVHVCDCLHAGRAKGLAAKLFANYPDANVYKERVDSGSRDVPGDVSIHSNRVVNLYAQLAPGPPRAKVGSPPPPEYKDHFEGLAPGCWDTAKDRLSWFGQSLNALPGKLPAEGPRGRRVSLAMPVGVGCEDDDQSTWAEYLNLLQGFALTNPKLRIVLYEPKHA